MNVLKFSHDYMKLPMFWDGTQALLIGVMHIPDMGVFRGRYPQVIAEDTLFRAEHEDYYQLTFNEGVLLTFFHFNSHRIFTTIRRYTDEKYKYYLRSEMETFELKRVME